MQTLLLYLDNKISTSKRYMSKVFSESRYQMIFSSVYVAGLKTMNLSVHLNGQSLKYPTTTTIIMASTKLKVRNEGKSEQETILQSRTVTDLSYLTAENQKHRLMQALQNKFGKVHAYHSRPEEGITVVYYVKQGRGNLRGYLLATLTESVTEYHKTEFSKNTVKVETKVETRPLTQNEYETIALMLEHPDEPHDFTTFKNDVFKVSEN